MLLGTRAASWAASRRDRSCPRDGDCLGGWAIGQRVLRLGRAIGDRLFGPGLFAFKSGRESARSACPPSRSLDFLQPVELLIPV